MEPSTQDSSLMARGMDTAIVSILMEIGSKDSGKIIYQRLASCSLDLATGCMASGRMIGFQAMDKSSISMATSTKVSGK
jgi:hypothetical protein